MPLELHQKLKTQAAGQSLSLNEYCSRILATATPDYPTAGSLGRELLTRALDVVGSGLVGIIVFGSWIRGDANDSSDIDVMLVVDEGVEIKRSLLTRWDEVTLRFDNRTVEAHVARLPDKREIVSGLWAELAVDGVIVFERGLELSRTLGRIRSEIALGRLQRRRSHGQDYWVRSIDEVA